jgi:hypothetical protein
VHAFIELEAGHRKPALRVLDAATPDEIRSVPLSGAFGVPAARPQRGRASGSNIAGTISKNRSRTSTRDTGKIDRDVSLPQPFFPVALARSPR